MAKPKGLYNHFVGTIDGVTYYYLNGKRVARKAGGGFTRESIKNKATMQPVRQNNNDFGHASSVNKQLRNAIKPLYKQHTMGYLHSRLMRPVKEVMQLDSQNQSGAKNFYNGIQDPDAVHLLRNFEFTPGNDLTTVFTFVGSYDSDSHAIVYPKVTPSFIKAPTAATHAVLEAALLVIDTEKESMDALRSEPVVLDLEDAKEQNVHLSFPAHERANKVIIPFLSIELVQAQGEYAHPLLGTAALSLGVV